MGTGRLGQGPPGQAKGLRQFELWWADLPAPVGRRPVLLLTRDAGYGYLNNIMVAEITTTIRGIPVEVVLGRAEGLKVRSVANLDNVHVISKSSLKERVGTLGPDRFILVKRALGWALDWPELKQYA